jgi:hypothetical protein
MTYNEVSRKEEKEQKEWMTSETWAKMAETYSKQYWEANQNARKDNGISSTN